MSVEFGVLGPVTVHRDGTPVAVRPGMSRALLAALLLEAGRTVSSERLIAALWDDQPPATATASLYNHVARLRRALGTQADRIKAVPKGYLIEVRSGELDLDTFTTLLSRAGAARRSDSWPAVSRLLTDALALLRGEPLADLPTGEVFDRERQRLGELLMQALDWRIDADLRLGNHREVVAELQTLTRDHPLREGFHAQLMLALYRSGRQAEALDVFARVRDTLSRELGVDPSSSLLDLHRRILAGDPALEAAAASRPAVPAVAPVPAQLPADIVDFTGRERQVELLHTASPGVQAITGPGGVGKTTLAVHIAHQMRSRAVDGQLYVNLRGAGAHPLIPADVLGGLLRDLGVAGDDLPVDEPGRSALYRSLLAGRRLLLLLDDAHDTAQVRPLLPGTEGCLVLITSRNRLSGLAGCRHLDLDVLDTEESLDLLAGIAGGERIGLEPEAAAEVATACAGLPLAIRIAGSRLRARPAWTVRHLADRLSAQEKRLHELQTDDLAVRTSFAMSYTNLPLGSSAPEPDPGRAFRLLGLWAGPDISTPAAAALIGEPVDRTESALEALVDVHLLAAPAPARYQLHDLLRLYAAERAAADTDAADSEAALTRLLAWYLATATAAGDALNPGRDLVASGELDPAGRPLTFADRTAAQDWCERECANLLSAIEQASASGRHPIAWQLTAALWPFFTERSHWSEWLRAAQIGLRSTRALQDATAEGRMLRSLGSALFRLGRTDEAIQVLEEALAVTRAAGDENGEASALNNLANSYQERGQADAALKYYNQALLVHRRFGNRFREAGTQNNIANALLSLGRFEEAADHAEQSIRINETEGFRSNEGYTLRTYGDILTRLGKTTRAAGAYRKALAVVREISDLHEEASILESLGRVLLDSEQTAEGTDILEQCYRLLTQLGDPHATAVAALLPSAAGPATAGGARPL